MPNTTMTDQEVRAAKEYVYQVARAFHLERFTDETLQGWRYTDDNERSQLSYHVRRYANAYSGTSGFMQSMHDLVQRGQLLTLRQTRGVLNVILADARQRNDMPASITAGTSARPEPVMPDGYYTIVLEDSPELRRTLRVRTSPRGVQYLSYLAGPDNTSSYQRFGWLRGAEVRLFTEYQRSEHVALAAELLVGYAQKDELDDSRQRFALVAGRCWNCGRMLTVPASIHRGLGPDCAARLGAL